MFPPGSCEMLWKADILNNSTGTRWNEQTDCERKGTQWTSDIYSAI